MLIGSLIVNLKLELKKEAKYATTEARMVSYFNTLRTGLFKLFKRLFPGFLTILTL